MKRDFKAEPPRVETDISLSVKALLDRIFDGYSAQFPTLVMLATGTISEGVEDLSDASLKSWAEKLESYSVEIARLAGQLQFLTPIDRAVVAEIQRFLFRQLLAYRQRIFITKAASSYQLICFALLPYYLRSQINIHDQSPEILNELRFKLYRCIDILDLMMKRVDQGITSHTKKDRQLASMIATSIQKWSALPEDLANALLSRLRKLAQTEGKETPLEATDTDSYLRDILGITAGPLQIVQALFSMMEEELLGLPEEIRRSESLQKIQRPTSLGSHDQVFDQVFILLSEKTKGVFLDTTSAKRPLCLVAPELISPFVLDALYLPLHGEGSIEDPSGALLVNPIYLNPNTMSLAGLALIMAHEIVPGHREQHRRWMQLPFSKLFSITRSPLGFEGWASHAESAVLELTEQDNRVQRAFKLQRIRRLTTVLLGLTNGRAEPVLNRILSNLPVHIRDELLGIAKRMSGVFHQMLPYTWGLYETKTTLSSIKSAYALSDAKAHELYLTLGPLHPQSIKAILGV